MDHDNSHVQKRANDLTEEQFISWYGPWQPLTVAQIVQLLHDSGIRWWIVGGLAIEAASGVKRAHDDIDVSIARDDLELWRQQLDLQLWEAHCGSLTPLLPGNRLTEGREQLWARSDATQPWLLDLLLSPIEGEDWVFKRDHSIRMPLSEAVFVKDDVPYLAPEAVLLYKAKLMRDKDNRDFDVMAPKLTRPARTWLADALGAHIPGHQWLERLR